MARETEKKNSKKKPLIGRKAKMRIGIALALLVGIVVFQNRKAVEVKVFFWDRPMPLVILLLLVFLSGMLLGYVLRLKR